MPFLCYNSLKNFMKSACVYVALNYLAFPHDIYSYSYSCRVGSKGSMPTKDSKLFMCLNAQKEVSVILLQIPKRTEKESGFTTYILALRNK